MDLHKIRIKNMNKIHVSQDVDVHFLYYIVNEKKKFKKQKSLILVFLFNLLAIRVHCNVRFSQMVILSETKRGMVPSMFGKC